MHLDYVHRSVALQLIWKSGSFACFIVIYIEFHNSSVSNKQWLFSSIMLALQIFNKNFCGRPSTLEWKKRFWVLWGHYWLPNKFYWMKWIYTLKGETECYRVVFTLCQKLTEISQVENVLLLSFSGNFLQFLQLGCIFSFNFDILSLFLMCEFIFFVSLKTYGLTIKWFWFWFVFQSNCWVDVPCWGVTWWVKWRVLLKAIECQFVNLLKIFL